MRRIYKQTLKQDPQSKILIKKVSEKITISKHLVRKAGPSYNYFFSYYIRHIQYLNNAISQHKTCIINKSETSLQMIEKKLDLIDNHFISNHFYLFLNGKVWTTHVFEYIYICIRIKKMSGMVSLAFSVFLCNILKEPLDKSLSVLKCPLSLVIFLFQFFFGQHPTLNGQLLTSYTMYTEDALYIIKPTCKASALNAL